eukprot:COSAG01_NODE_5606_length_4150_cov_3.488028_4_plen_346_part_00
MITIMRAVWLLPLLAQALLPRVAVVSAADPDEDPDADGNEKLSVKELQVYMDFSLKQARKAVERFDDTGDGELDSDEFEKLTEYIEQQREQMQNQEEDQEGYDGGPGGDPDDHPDTDDSGGLSPAELLAFWKKGKDWDDKQAEYFTLDWFAKKVKKFDKDVDKQLNGKEYQKFIDAKDQPDDDRDWGEHEWGKSTAKTDCGAFNCYEVLGLPNPLAPDQEGKEPASPRQIKKVYRKLSIMWHPDKCKDTPEGRKSRGSNAKCETHFQTIAAAYEILSNPHKRKAYDYKMWSSKIFRSTDFGVVMLGTFLVGCAVQYAIQHNTYEELLALTMAQVDASIACRPSTL